MASITVLSAESSLMFNVVNSKNVSNTSSVVDGSLITSISLSFLTMSNISEPIRISEFNLTYNLSNLIACNSI